MRCAATIPLILLASAGHAQTVWHRQAPLPFGWNLGKAAFNSPTHGFVCADDRHVFETFDAGETWTTRTGQGTNDDPFYTMGFGDAQHAIVLGNNMTTLRTADGGSTWLPSPGPSFGSWSHLDFVSGVAAFAGANGAVAFTPDAGVSWSVRGFYPDCPIMFGMDFRDELVGLAGGIRSTPHNDEGIYRTIDGGVTWTLVFDHAVNDVIWTDANTAIAIVGVDIYASFDAGLTWELWGGIIPTGLSDMELVLPGVICGVSLSGDAWLSTDFGQSWFQTLIGMGTAPAVWQVHFSDPLHGWISGANGLLYKSTDSGFSWELVTRGVGDEVTSIVMHDENNGFGVTHTGYVLRTTDGGSRWTASQPNGFSFYGGLSDLDFLNPTSGIAVGQGPTILRTYDGGESWIDYGSSSGLSGHLDLAAVAMVDEQHAFIATNYGTDTNLYETFDDGATWTPRMDLPPAFFVDMEFRGNLGWLACACNLFWRTTNSGQTWQRVTIPGDSSQMAAFDFAPDNTTGWIVGWYGACYRSTNAGLSWTAQNVGGPDATLLGVRAVSATEAWAVGQWQFYPAVWHTTNGGASWQRQPMPRDLFSLSEVATVGDKVWLAGFNGAILANFEAAPRCTADFSGSSDPNAPTYGVPDGAVDLADFFYFLDQFVAGNAEVADLTGASDPNAPSYGRPDGTLDTSDFFYYLDQFVLGC